MSQLKELITQYDQRLTQAVSDHFTVLQILSEYRKSVVSLKDCCDEIKEEFSSMIDNRSKTRLDFLLIAASAHPSPTYVESLCAILELQDQVLQKEQIVDLLYKIPSPKAVPYLKKACSIKLPHDDYDEFGVKCLEALAAINTSEAWAAIHAAAEGSSPRIQEHIHELNDWRRVSGN